MADGMTDTSVKPTEEISVRDVFGIDTDMVVKGFAEPTDRVPEVDHTYKFDPDTTLAILAGFSANRRVMIQGYHGTGNDNAWGQRYADTLTRIMNHDFTHIRDSYDRACIGEYAGAKRAVGWDGILEFWVGLRSSFPHAEFKIHHQIGMEADMLSPRAAIRWSLDGKHDGWGSFGEPTGADVHVMGMCHAEFGPYGPDGVGLRREFALDDEIAIWKQILMQSKF